MKTNKELIIKALGITDLEYSEKVEEYGYAWIKRYFNTDELATRALSECASFWQWWINQWDHRDVDFIRLTHLNILANDLTKHEVFLLRSIYVNHHNVYGYFIVPNRFVINDVNNLISQEIKNLETLKKAC